MSSFNIDCRASKSVAVLVLFLKPFPSIIIKPVNSYSIDPSNVILPVPIPILSAHANSPLLHQVLKHMYH